MIITAHISTFRLLIAIQFELQISFIYISVLGAMTPCATGNNKKTEAAKLEASPVSTCDITNVNIQEVYLIVHSVGRLFYVTWSFFRSCGILIRFV
jgi:hypothetical protein